MRSPRKPSRPGNTRAGALLAFVFCIGGGLINLWIAITGPEVSGGIPFIPYELNQMIGRVFFGVSGVICFGISVLAFRDLR